MSGLAAPAHRNAEADAGDVDGRAGCEAGLGGGILKHLARHHAEIERRAGGGKLDEVRRRVELDGDLVSAGALELRNELVQRSGDAAAGDGLELSGVCSGHR
jgi:hypothetical protein